MGPILHLRKELIAPPVVGPVPGTHLRAFAMPDDVPRWLALRARAMAEQLPSVRSWTQADFHAEMVKKPWWRTNRTWLALDAQKPLGDLLGSVTLAMREGKLVSIPVVHWLFVDPIWRRHGIGRMLLSHLEKTAWDAGWREVQLETHVRWSAAVAFYQSMGYAPLPERSPR